MGVFLVGVIGSAITHGVSSVSLYLIINGCVAIVISVFLAPFIAALINVTYVDLRVRKEGVDHGMLLSGETPTGPSPGVAPLSDPTPPTQAPPSDPPAGGPPPSQPPPSQPPPSQPPSA